MHNPHTLFRRVAPSRSPWKRLAHLAGLAALSLGLAMPLAVPAWAHARPKRETGPTKVHVRSRAADAIVKPPASVVQNDLSLTGTITQGTAKAVLELSLDGSVPIREAITSKTMMVVGPYAVGPSFLVPGTVVQTWTHIDAKGNIVADFVSLRPTVVQGTRSAGALVKGKDGESILSVTSPTGPVEIVLSKGTVVHIVPPWDRSQGLSVVTEVAAVGVMRPDGTLLAAEVLGVAASSN